MCELIARIKYKAASESPVLIPFENEDAANTRIDELLKLDTVASVKLYKPHRVIERVEGWKTKEIA